MRYFAFAVILASLALAGDSGVPPRQDASSYPVHQTLKNFSLGAAIVPTDQVKKTFSGDIANKYAVVEVAFYPDAGEIDVERQDFVLRVGENTLIHPERPDEVALPWTDRKAPSLPGNTHVTTEAGVVCGAGTSTGGPYGTNPGTAESTNNGGYNNNRTRGCGTYEGVGVSNYPTGTSSNPSSTAPNAVDIKIQHRALPEGKTTQAVAGYLYFAISSKQRKNASLFLEYSKDGKSVELALPASK